MRAMGIHARLNNCDGHRGSDSGGSGSCGDRRVERPCSPIDSALWTRQAVAQHITNAEDLVQENARLRAELAELQLYFNGVIGRYTLTSEDFLETTTDKALIDM